MGMFAGKPKKAAEPAKGVYDSEDFVRQCFVPMEGLVCTSMNKGFYHTKTMDFSGYEGPAEKTIELCSYILYDCAVQDKQCNLTLSAKGLEVSFHGCLIFPPEDKDGPHRTKSTVSAVKKPKAVVDPIQERIQAAEADETRYVLKVEIQAIVRSVAHIYDRNSVTMATDKEAAVNKVKSDASHEAGDAGVGSNFLGALRRFNFSRRATARTGTAHSLTESANSIANLLVSCESIVIDQSGDAMVSSWLPVEDVLEALQVDLNNKLQDKEF